MIEYRRDHIGKEERGSFAKIPYMGITGTHTIMNRVS